MYFELAVAFIIVMAFTYAGYPAVAWVLSKVARRPVIKGSYTPFVSVIMPVHNEGARVARKIANVLAQDYPRGNLEIIVVDDGSTDGCVDSVSGGVSASLRIVRLLERGGKANALNAGISGARGEVMVFTDARQLLGGDALRRLVASFADKRVTAVTGRLVPGREGAEGAFRRYEETLRKWEAAWGSCAGATGALYAVRSAAVRSIPSESILDDLVISLSAASRGRLVYAEEAVAYEVDEEDERTRTRRLRTLAGNWQMLLGPRRFGCVFSWRTFAQVTCHKILRLAFPFFAAAALVCIALTSVEAVAACLAAAAATGVVLISSGRHRRVAETLAYLCVAPVQALVRYLTGRETVLWGR